MLYKFENDQKKFGCVGSCGYAPGSVKYSNSMIFEASLCHERYQKILCNVWFFSRIEPCSKCLGWNATTLIWLLSVHFQSQIK